MSYCRFSTDDFKSDIYLYHTLDDRYIIHVAEYKLTAPYDEHVQATTFPTMERIGLPMDGKSFYFFSPQLAYDQLLWLREMGYYVPESALDRLTIDILKLRGKED